MRTNSAGGLCWADAEQSDESWIQGELTGCQFKDERLGKRFSMVLKQLAEGTAESIPLACQNWANTKAAYRFFANDRVSDADILAGHFRSTRERTAAVRGTLLVLHDTTEFSYPRENIGLLHAPRDPKRHRQPLCGILMHSSLVVTPAGLPPGLSLPAPNFTRPRKKIGPAFVPLVPEPLNLLHPAAPRMVQMLHFESTRDNSMRAYPDLCAMLVTFRIEIM